MSVCVRERERETETETERETDRQTDRQTEKEKEKERDTERQRQTDRQFIINNAIKVVSTRVLKQDQLETHKSLCGERLF